MSSKPPIPEEPRSRVGHDHSQDEGTYGDWPEPPDGLTSDELAQLERVLEGVTVMVSKALYHRRESGHYCTFRTTMGVRDHHIEMIGAIECEGKAWEETQADLALRALNSQHVKADDDAVAAALRAEGMGGLLATRKLTDGSMLVIFPDLSAVIQQSRPEWLVLMRDGRRLRRFNSAVGPDDDARGESDGPGAGADIPTVY